MKIFHLPDLGEGLAEAEIREWYVKEGDLVKLDQPLLSVETAKAVVDVPSPYAGRIVKLHGQAHEIIKTHAPLVEFEGDGQRTAEQKDKGSIVGKLEENPQALREEGVIIGSQAALSTPAFKVLPTVRVLAKQLQVDLSAVTPTGPKGQITAEDVKRQAQQGQGSHLPSAITQGESLHGVRRAMALTMTMAHQEVAQVTIIDDADLGHLAEDADLTVLLLQAMSQASQVEPALNAWFDGKTLKRQLFTEVNIGIAMDTPEGLFVPVLKKVNQSTPAGLRDQINQFKNGVRSRTIAASDMQGATLTLSNFGTLAGKYASPIVVPPTVAILGCGRAYEAVIARDGKAVMTRLLPLSLSTDHRAVTGGEAARFLAEILRFLKEQR